MHNIKYSWYPNNEIRATHYYRRPESKESSDEHDEISHDQKSGRCTDPEGDRVSGLPPTLDISSDLSKRTALPLRKRTRFGLNAKRTILRMGGAFDTIDNNSENYVFLTGTIPGGSHEAFQAVAEESLYIVRRISDWLSKTYKSDYWFYCWELQKRGALHIHYCIHPNDPGSIEKILSEWKRKWEDILNKVSKKRSVDVWIRKDGTYHSKGHSVLQAYAQRVHTSVAAYMAGYLAGAKDKHSADEDSPYFPSRWWGASRKATNLLKGLTREILSQHNDYRSACYEIQAHYERVLHDSPKVYRYSHKVGIGSSVVSYHPEDKGTKIWQGLEPMLYQPKMHPNTCFMIALSKSTLSAILSWLEVSKKPPKSYSIQLYSRLKDLVFPGTQRGYSISRTDIMVLLEIPCELNSPFTDLHPPERYRKRLVLLQVAFRKYLPEMKWDKHGYLCSEKDLPGTVDTNWFICQDSTIEPKGSVHRGGEDNGYLSPQSPSSQQLSIPCLSPPTEQQ